MIVRIFRAQVRPGQDAAFEQQFRERAVPFVRTQPGLVAFYSGRPMATSPGEFVMVTIWRDLAALEAFAGADWRQAVILAEERPFLEQTWVYHYEVLDAGGAA